MKKFLVTLTLTIALVFSLANESSASSTYTIKKGDSLYKISRMHNTTVANLKVWNNLKSDLIHPNQKLVVTSGGQAVKNPVKKPATTTPSRSDADKVQKEFIVSATAYTAYCNGCSGITKTGINLKKNPGLKVIAVDPKVIKLGTKVHVEGYGYAVAGDIGGAIKGNKIDVFIPTKSAAYQWGRKNVKIKILE
ncbi:3D domain-containing protein [Sporosarcina sp. G11-34]|uniref:3D domain-containing protein n=1 Tax=Sporosarcina sp. G11-34 TaxID=2849605 RepID=UPI0022A934C1|nr:LysM peptidoglycan-binding and 3D domain-containing protein [Sporosarcina sp. G11-34]MCZ2257928.1 LysM peptidoglycan-binding domain-containing protein [Sporosarcina sp. G11-34]